jgi:hypothetical protein
LGYTNQNIRAGNNGLIEIEMFEARSDDGGPGGPPPNRYAVNITVSGTPVNPSYEGMPPIITGFLVEVWYNDGSREIITDMSLLWTSPSIMHAEMGFTNVPVRIGHISSPFLSSPIILPEVIPLIPTGFHVHGITDMQQFYYEDALPNFNRLTAELIYTDGVIATVSNLSQEYIFSELMSGHPNNTGNPLPNGIDPVNRRLFIRFSRGATYAEHKVVVLPLQAVHLITGIQVEGLSNWTTTFYVNDPPTAFTDEHLLDSGLRLMVSYDNNDSRVITMDDFTIALGMGRAEIVSRPNFSLASNPSSVFVRLSYYGQTVDIVVPTVNSPRP